MTEMSFRNIFKCDCGNCESFSSMEKSTKESTIDTTCSYCMKRKIMKFIKVVEN